MRKFVYRSVLLSIILVAATCSTQRYGRMTPLSATERREFSCKDIRMQIASTEEFLSDVRRQRADTNGAHVLGFFGDLGIGNTLEGNAAETSGETRLKEFRDLNIEKNCDTH